LFGGWLLLWPLRLGAAWQLLLWLAAWLAALLYKKFYFTRFCRWQLGWQLGWLLLLWLAAWLAAWQLGWQLSVTALPRRATQLGWPGKRAQAPIGPLLPRFPECLSARGISH